MKTQTGEIQNISGEINATFPNTDDPSGKSFVRAAYKSQRIKSPEIPSYYYLVIGSNSGSPDPSPIVTGDFRGLDFSLRHGITSGTYDFPRAPNSELMGVQYSEMANVKGSYHLQGLTETKATLELDVLENGRYYKSKRFTITGKTHKGVTLYLEANFELYVTID